MKSYDYSHRQGVHEVSWKEFGELAMHLVEGIAGFKPQIITGIARAGLFPATAAACMLRCEMYPIRLTRRENDVVRYQKPVWKVAMPTEVAGRVVVVIDEIADTGETLMLAAKEARAKGAKRVLTASLMAHSWANPLPDVVALITDALVIFPWDRKVLVDGAWQMHPEIRPALRNAGESQ